jgi:signal recognition particle subunit SEC65
MVIESQKGELRRQFVSKAETVFERAIERGLAKENIRLSEIEEIVNELKFELTQELVEDIIRLQPIQQGGPGPKCDICGREAHYKGQKKRPGIQTSQGDIEVERAYYYCEECKSGLFPPGSPAGDQSPGLERAG